jgi:hypothetical protein
MVRLALAAFAAKAVCPLVSFVPVDSAYWLGEVRRAQLSGLGVRDVPVWQHRL